MIKVEDNYTTEFYYLFSLWRYRHLKFKLGYAFLCVDFWKADGKTISVILSAAYFAVHPTGKYCQLFLLQEKVGLCFLLNGSN